MLATSSLAQNAESPSQPSFVRSKDGTRTAVECAGKGPSLLIVYGGTGDRSCWEPLVPLFAAHFTVCAMDRRGHGASEAGSNYSLEKEFEDVAAVVDSRAGPCSSWVLGHSIGGLCALEAAFLTDRISKLVLYEPPLQDPRSTADHDVVNGVLQRSKRPVSTRGLNRNHNHVLKRVFKNAANSACHSGPFKAA